jgi:hypothetical protein
LVCAAPSYFKAHGTPRSPEELRRHTIISATGLTSTSEWLPLPSELSP